MKGCLVDFICFTYFYSFTRFHTLNSSWQLSRNLGHAASSECGSANLLHRRPLPWQLCHAGPCSCMCFNAKKCVWWIFGSNFFQYQVLRCVPGPLHIESEKTIPFEPCKAFSISQGFKGNFQHASYFSAKKSVIHAYFLLKNHSKKKKRRKPSAIGKSLSDLTSVSRVISRANWVSCKIDTGSCPVLPKEINNVWRKAGAPFFGRLFSLRDV